MTPQDRHTLQERDGKKHTFLVGNKTAVGEGGNMPDLFISTPYGPHESCSLVMQKKSVRRKECRCALVTKCPRSEEAYPWGCGLWPVRFRHAPQ